jgi:hypothetical protein
MSPKKPVSGRIRANQSIKHLKNCHEDAVSLCLLGLPNTDWEVSFARGDKNADIVEVFTASWS